MAYFTNYINVNTKTVHRVDTGSTITACGVSMKNDTHRIEASDVTCKRCKDTDTYRWGGH